MLLLILLTILSRTIHLDHATMQWQLQYLRENNRVILPPLDLLSFVLVAYLATWLLVAGVRDGRSLVRLAALWFQRLITWPPLRTVGRYGVEMFSLHLVLVYLVLELAGGRPLPEHQSLPLAMAPVLVMFAGAHWLERRRLRARLAAG
ncbi:MAG: OpgC domain-containing protein [Alphaproteobacteria bacterium]|nr:OpgC domain-containing protein [Alphaproteobacteria bacterium]